MNAVTFEILLFYYWSPEQFAWTHSNSESGATRFLANNGLLKRKEEGAYFFEITKRGRVYIQHALDTPLPVHEWVRGTSK